MDSPPPPDVILRLPEEVLERVLLHLPATDIIHASQTCRSLSSIVKSSPSVQYSLVRQERGYIDVPVRPEARAAARERELQAQELLSAVAAPDNDSDEHNGSTGLSELATKPWHSRGSRRSLSLPPDGSPNDDGDDQAGAGPVRNVTKSPHTGQTRPSISTVTLAPFHPEPPRTRADYSCLSVIAKTRALRARERRWDSVTPAQVRTFTVQGPSGVYELQEGILLMCEENRLQDKPSIIRLIPLPNVQDPDLEDPIIPTQSNSVKFPISDLTLDPTQDLVVVSEFEPEPQSANLNPPAHRFHFLTMSTFEPHPLAAQPFIDFPPVRVRTNWPRQLLQVMGDTLAVHVSREGLNVIGMHGQNAIVTSESEEELVAWNWKTGEVLGRFHMGHTTAPCTFCMLTPTTVAIARPTVLQPPRSTDFMIQRRPDTTVCEEPGIVIISFAQKPGPKVHIDQPLLADREDKTTPRAVELTCLYLPELARQLTVDNFHMRPDPAFPNVPSDQQTLGRGKPFTQDPKRGLIVTELWLSDRLHQEPINYELFILRETLVKMAEEGEERMHAAWATGDKVKTLKLSWKEWGPDNSRMMPQVQETRRPWVCSCSGYRMASLVTCKSSFGGEPWRKPEVEDPDEPIVTPKYPVQLVVHDFNPYAIARDRVERRRRGAEATSQWIVEAETDENGDAGNGAPELAPEYTVTLWDEPTVVPADDTWTEDIVTRLPFRTVRRGFATESSPNGVMMDAERILAVRTGKVDAGWHKHDVTVLCM